MQTNGLELTHLRVFVAVCEHGHFGRAAAELNMTPSAVSKRVAACETILDVPLFVRQRHGVNRTAAGECLYRRTASLLDEIEDALSATKAAGEGAGGTLRLGYSSAALAAFLADGLRRLRTALPDLQLALTEGPSSAQVEALEHRRVDLAFPLYVPAPSGLAAKALTEVPLGLVVPAAHRLAQGSGPVSLAELRDERLILFPRRLNPMLYDSIVKACAEAGFTARVARVVSPREAAVALVAVGEGIAFIIAPLAHLAIAGTAYRPLAPPTPTLRFYAVWREEQEAVAQRWLSLMFPSAVDSA